MKYTIYHTNKKQKLFTAEIDVYDDTFDEVIPNLVVKWAMKHRDGDLRWADLSYLNLYKVNLSYADLSYANLSYATLSYADMSFANLEYANFTGIDFISTIFTDANLINANFTGAVFTDVIDIYNNKTVNSALGLKEAADEASLAVVEADLDEQDAWEMSGG